jgi:hypothetical protein
VHSCAPTQPCCGARAGRLHRPHGRCSLRKSLRAAELSPAAGAHTRRSTRAAELVPRARGLRLKAHAHRSSSMSMAAVAAAAHRHLEVPLPHPRPRFTPSSYSLAPSTPSSSFVASPLVASFRTPVNTSHNVLCAHSLSPSVHFVLRFVR